MKLFWVTTDDHDEDWFVVASSLKKAAIGQTKQKNQGHNS
jgi:hypothetical protein